jgi:hypothetical protein
MSQANITCFQELYSCVYDWMCLFCWAISLAEAELMIEYKSVVFSHWENLFDEELFKNMRYSG